MDRHKMKVRIAILDLYEGVANQGMRCIREIIRQWGTKNTYNVELHEFDVRQKCDVPDLSYDIYISSGGPGSPLESEGLNGIQNSATGFGRLKNGTMILSIFPKNMCSLFVIVFNWHAVIIKLRTCANASQLHSAFFPYI